VAQGLHYQICAMCHTIHLHHVGCNILPNPKPNVLGLKPQVLGPKPNVLGHSQKVHNNTLSQLS